MSLRNVKSPRVVDIVTGVYGVLYNSEWFDVDTIAEEAKLFPGNDDIVISGHLRDRGIQRVAVPFHEDETVTEQNEVKRIDSLWWSKNKHSQLNDNALKQFGFANITSSYLFKLLTFNNPFLRPRK